MCDRGMSGQVLAKRVNLSAYQIISDATLKQGKEDFAGSSPARLIYERIDDMRTQEEIKNRIKETKDDDIFGFGTTDLIEYLDFEHAKKYLEEGVTEKQWSNRKLKSPKEQMIQYMEFAWEKANDCRGLSAMRTMYHYRSWLWLDGNEELAEQMEDYEFYGKDNLVAVCEYLGIDHTEYDDGIRTNE